MRVIFAFSLTLLAGLSTGIGGELLYLRRKLIINF